MAPGSRATARALNPEDPAPNLAHCSLGTGTARGGEFAAAPPTTGASCHRFPPPGALPCRVAITPLHKVLGRFLVHISQTRNPREKQRSNTTCPRFESNLMPNIKSLLSLTYLSFLSFRCSAPLQNRTASEGTG